MSTGFSEAGAEAGEAKQVILISALLSPIPALFAWIALAWSYNHIRKHEWAHALGMGTVGLMLAGSAPALLAPLLGV